MISFNNIYEKFNSFFYPNLTKIQSLDDLTPYVGKVVKYTSDGGRNWDYFLIQSTQPSGEIQCIPESKAWEGRLVSARVLFSADSFRQKPGNPPPYFETASFEEFQFRPFEVDNFYLDEEKASKLCSKTQRHPTSQEIVCKAPLTIVRSSKKTDLNISVLFESNFKPRNPIEPKPTTITQEKDGVRFNWSVQTEKDGVLKIGTDRLNMIWWEAIRKTEPQDSKSFNGIPVKREELNHFLTDTLTKLGVKPKELHAFVEYWHTVLSQGYDPENTPYVLVELVKQEDIEKYVPRMEIDQKDTFSLSRFYFRFKPVSQVPPLRTPSYIEGLIPQNLGSNVVIDLGGEIVDSSEIKIKGEGKDYPRFEQEFIRNHIYV